MINILKKYFEDMLGKYANRTHPTNRVEYKSLNLTEMLPLSPATSLPSLTHPCWTASLVCYRVRKETNIFCWVAFATMKEPVVQNPE